MYCTKCGKEARSGDVYCSGCGNKLEGKKKSKSWILIPVCALAVVVSAVNLFHTPKPEPVPFVQQRETICLPDAQINPNVQLPEEPKDGDILEDSDYPGGLPRRRVDDYDTSVYVSDYRPDGTMLRDTILYYSNGSYGGIRVTNYDDHGNKTDTTETTDKGELWLYLYYQNSYDEQGRPLVLAEYNRMGYPLCVYEYTYNADGSYTMECSEYRGYVYEYDREYNPQGTTSIWLRSTTTFNAEGDVIDQYMEEVN